MADAIQATDYSPFGAIMPGRNFNSNSYRFGFNGQEKTDEISGSGNHNTALFWEYDTRLGRRWNLDPVDKPWQTRYHAFSNKPIWNIDPNGANDDDYTTKSDGSVEVKKTDDKFDRFYHEKKDGEKKFLGQFDKNENGMVKLPATGINFKNFSKPEKSFVEGFTLAGILGAGEEFKQETGLDIQINQLNNAEGGHSGHAGKGQFADIRYANKNGNVNEGSVWTDGANYDAGKSQILVDKFVKFGFQDSKGRVSILTENAKQNGPALKNTHFPGHGSPSNPYHHRHHIHLQHNINFLKNQ